MVGPIHIIYHQKSTSIFSIGGSYCLLDLYQIELLILHRRVNEQFLDTDLHHHGLQVTPDGYLYVLSYTSRAMYRIVPANTSSVAIPNQLDNDTKSN